MAYTSTDLANIEAAILALATGTRIVSVSYGDKQITYSQSDLPQLKILKSDIQASLGTVPLRTKCKQVRL